MKQLIFSQIIAKRIFNRLFQLTAPSYADLYNIALALFTPMFGKPLFILTILLTNVAFGQNLIVTRIERTDLVQLAENRLKILIEGYKCRDIIVKVDRGHIRLDAANCSIIFTAADTSIHRAVIDIGVKTKNKIEWLQTMDLPVIPLPDPVASVGGYPSGDSISRAALIAQAGLGMPRDVEWRQRIKSYSVKVVRSDSTIFERHGINGFEFNQELKEFFRTVRPQDQIIFYDITAILQETEERRLRQVFFLFIK